MTPDCQHCLEHLDDFRRHTLSSGQMTDMEAHLKQCPECSSELVYRNSIASDLRNSLPDTDPGPGLTLAVRNAISSASQTSPRQKSQLLPWMLSAAMVTLGIIAFVQHRAPELTIDNNIATIYRKPPHKPVMATSTDTAVALESRVLEIGPAESAAETLLDSSEIPAGSTNLGLSDQTVSRQKSAESPLKEQLDFAPRPPEVSPPPAIPASASVPALATRRLYSEPDAVEYKRESASFDSKRAIPAKTAGAAGVGAMAQQDKSILHFYSEGQTSPSDSLSTAAITSGTISSTSTLTTSSL